MCKKWLCTGPGLVEYHRGISKKGDHQHCQQDGLFFFKGLANMINETDKSKDMLGVSASWAPKEYF